jgi:hypothetical protein
MKRDHILLVLIFITLCLLPFTCKNEGFQDAPWYDFTIGGVKWYKSRYVLIGIALLILLYVFFLYKYVTSS